MPSLDVVVMAGGQKGLGVGLREAGHNSARFLSVTI
jgi:hypothetical protein